MLVGLEGLLLCVLAVLEVVALDSGRATMGITTGLFFLVLGAGLLFCAWDRSASARGRAGRWWPSS